MISTIIFSCAPHLSTSLLPMPLIKRERFLPRLFHSALESQLSKFQPVFIFSSIRLSKPHHLPSPHQNRVFYSKPHESFSNLDVEVELEVDVFAFGGWNGAGKRGRTRKDDLLQSQQTWKITQRRCKSCSLQRIEMKPHSTVDNTDGAAE